MKGSRASQWQALRSKYVAGLGERISQLREAWQAVERGEDGSQALDALAAISHKWVGSGEAYGFAGISACARALETAIRTLDDPAQAVAVLQLPLQQLLEALQDAAGENVRADAGEVFSTPALKAIPAHPVVILAEDDADVGADLCRVLAQHDFHVEWIDNLAELPALVERCKPVAAIIDMVFPEGKLAGAESILKLREKAGPPLPVIFMSACNDFDVRLASVRAGGSHFFNKPLRNDQLVKTLRSLIGHDVAEPYRLLLVDDDHALLDLYRETLGEAGFRVFCADNALTAVQLMAEHDPELVLLDLHMPDCNGLELGQIIRQHEQFASTPLLFMSSDTRSDVQLACVRLAGDEFITKPIEPWRLLMAVESRVRRSRLLRQQRLRQTGELAMQVDHDLLTALPNLRLLRQEITRTLEVDGAAFALCKLDLDDFHTINDVYGHVVGDRLLQRLAWNISHQLSSDDMLCRESGDEFWILLRDQADAASLLPTLEKVLRAVRQPFVMEGNLVSITASMGVAMAPQDGRCADDLLKCVDTALFHAKRDAAGSYSFFAAHMQEALLRQHTIEQELRLAFEQHQFLVYYQPVFSVAGRELAGFEALVRWLHPRRGILSPQDFIGVVETRGMAGQLTRLVLREAIAQLQKWRERWPDIFMSVNLTAIDTQDAALTEEVMTMLASAGVPPSALVLELTESMLITDWSAGGANLQALSNAGVRLAIDDFGTGYSSLSYLNRFPVDKLKIDRSFIASWLQERDDRLVRAIVHLGCNLKFCVVAEGVEANEQLMFLQSLGCQEFQGFLLSEPLAPTDVERRDWFRGRMTGG